VVVDVVVVGGRVVDVVVDVSSVVSDVQAVTTRASPTRHARTFEELWNMQ
jgi:hypothetical protein